MKLPLNIWSKIILIPIGIAVVFVAIAGSRFLGRSNLASVFFLPSTSFGATVNFAVFGATGITNTRSTTITGDVGVSPATTITGFSGVGAGGAGTIVGNAYIHPAATAVQARTDLDTAYTALKSANVDNQIALVGSNYLLDGLTLTPGVYEAPSLGQPIVLGNAKTLTLNGTSDPDAAFIIRGGKNITLGSNSRVVLINTTACNVFWENDFDITIGGGAIVNGTFVSGGTIGASAGAATGPTVYGRLLAKTTVTMDWARVTAPTCIPRSNLNVVVIVDNDYGGTETSGSVNVAVAGSNVSNPSFVGTDGTSVTLDTDTTYTVNGTDLPGYTRSYSGNCTGPLGPNESATCTIRYVQDNPLVSMFVIKNVVGGGPKPTPDKFTMYVRPDSFLATLHPQFSFPGESSPGTMVSLPVGADYIVGENSDPDYTQQMSGDCQITVESNHAPYVCTITNTYTPSVTTGTLVVIKNVVGEALSSDFTMVVTATQLVNAAPTIQFPGDSEGTPVPLEGNATYSVDELPTPTGYTKTFSGDCVGTILAGETKICTVTNTQIVTTDEGSGDRNGGGGNDPSIGLTEQVNIPRLSAPGYVIYTYTVKNTGDFDITNVDLNDIACSDVGYVSGDQGKGGVLEIDESWIYNCTAYVTQDVKSVSRVTGLSDGETVTDVAGATVTISTSSQIPNPNLLPIDPLPPTTTPSNLPGTTPTGIGFPKTGFPPRNY